MAGSGQEALSEGLECLVGPHGGSGGPPSGPIVVGTPSRRVGSSRKAFPVGRK